MAKAKTTPPRKTRAAPKPRAPRATPPNRFGIGAIAAIGTALLGAGAVVAGLLVRRGKAANPAGHAAPDLALDRPRPGPETRAPEAFRPDPTAVPTEAEREALRPATGPAPTIVAGHSADRI